MTYGTLDNSGQLIGKQTEVSNEPISPISPQYYGFLNKAVVSTVRRPTLTLDVPILSQYPDYPSGSEIIASVELLKYYKIHPLDIELFVEKYVTFGEFESLDKRYGPHPSDAFIGDPNTYQGYGCYARTMMRAINRYLIANNYSYKVLNITNVKLEDAVEMTLGRDVPLCIWVTEEMKEPEVTDSWYIKETGDYFEWYGNNHTVLIVGYTKDQYILMDPKKDEYVYYDKEAVENCYEKLGRQAFTVVPLQIY